MIQGVIDVFWEEEDGLVLLDYKTDRVSPSEIPARAERYRTQLLAYAGALERIFGLPVQRCVLWFLHPGVEHEIPLENQ